MFGSLRYNIGTARNKKWARPVRMHKKKAGKLQTGSTFPKQYWLAVNGKPKTTCLHLSVLSCSYLDIIHCIKILTSFSCQLSVPRCVIAAYLFYSITFRSILSFFVFFFLQLYFTTCLHNYIDSGIHTNSVTILNTGV